MKSLVLLTSAVLLFVVFCIGFLPAEPISIGLAQIESIGVNADTAAVAAELIQTSLSKLPLFQLIERKQLDKILSEQELQLSGITDASSAVRAGEILNLQKIVFGSMGKYESEYIDYLLSLRVVDVEKASVELAESVQIRSGEDLQAAIDRLIQNIAGQIEKTGRIVRIESDAVYTSLGKEMGLNSADILSVYTLELIRDEEGSVIMREQSPVANLIVEQVGEAGSRCRILDSVGEIKKGLYVEKGRTELNVDTATGSIQVSSIPKNARVFLDSEFIGLTPLEMEDIVPGKHRLEIRSGGFKTYSADITLAAGRSVRIEEELETEIEVEELLLLGKVPRKQTDPGTAASKALIPGQGYTHNGYKNHGLLVPSNMLLQFSLSGLALYNALDKNSFLESTPEPGASATYDEKLSYYRNELGFESNLNSFIILASSGLYGYLFSILDSALTASADFLYPTYVEVSVGGIADYNAMKQSSDSSFDSSFNQYMISGASSINPGGYFDLIYQGRRLFLLLGIGFTPQPIYIDFASFYRFGLGESLYIGPGMMLTANMTRPDGIDITESEFASINPLINVMYSPALSVSFMSTYFTANIYGSPYIIAESSIFRLPSGTSYTSVEHEYGLRGAGGGLSLTIFFNLHLGLRIAGDYYYFWSIAEKIRNAGIAAIDNQQLGRVKLGLSFRM